MKNAFVAGLLAGVIWLVAAIGGTALADGGRLCETSYHRWHPGHELTAPYYFEHVWTCEANVGGGRPSNDWRYGSK